MASTSVQGITSSSSSSPPLYMYDVFLSFRGKDTRNNFTSHLYSNLAQRGIDVYMDDRELERGKTIEPALWKAIEESRFSVIIFSRDYASSPWCLDELVKIVQCMKEMGHTVLPVFYDVDPSETYEKAFVEHEQNFKENLEKVQIWKDCLSTVTNLSGGDIRKRENEEKVQRWMDILSEVEISSGSRSAERKSQAKKVVCIPAPAAANSRSSGEVVPSDLWAWKKYGQKHIKGSPYPRGYYRCSSTKGCLAKKHVERSRNDPNMLVITYNSEHNHPWPTQRNALAGSTRSQPTKSNAASKSSTGAQARKTANTKEDQKESSNDTLSPTDIIGGSSTASASVKEESDDIEKQMEMDDNEFSEGFS
uniref:TIR domain-containing protein n=1 Tax=Populus trichocarpa TaxID=3694 RepID=A0A3N7H682_POPTR